MSIKLTITKDNYIAIANVLSSFKGAEALTSGKLLETMQSKAKDQGVAEVKDIADFSIDVDQLQLASVKQGLIALVDDKIGANDIALLLLIAGEFKIRKTVEAGISAKLPPELPVDELDDLVELD